MMYDVCCHLSVIHIFWVVRCLLALSTSQHCQIHGDNFKHLILTSYFIDIDTRNQNVPQTIVCLRVWCVWDMPKWDNDYGFWERKVFWYKNGGDDNGMAQKEPNSDKQQLIADIKRTGKELAKLQEDSFGILDEFCRLAAKKKLDVCIYSAFILSIHPPTIIPIHISPTLNLNQLFNITAITNIFSILVVPFQ